MNALVDAGLQPDATQITDRKQRYSAGVLKYRQMGYWQPDYHAERYGRLLRVTGGRERLVAALAEQPDAPPLPGEREALARALHRPKNRCYADIVHEGLIPLRPGVRELLEEATARGVRQAPSSPPPAAATSTRC